jgi:hypothetical protein
MLTAAQLAAFRRDVLAMPRNEPCVWYRCVDGPLADLRVPLSPLARGAGWVTRLERGIAVADYRSHEPGLLHFVRWYEPGGQARGMRAT